MIKSADCCHRMVFPNVLGVGFDNPNKTSSSFQRFWKTHCKVFLLFAIMIDSKKCSQFDNLHQSVVEVKSNGFVSVTIAIRSEHAA